MEHIICMMTTKKTRNDDDDDDDDDRYYHHLPSQNAITGIFAPQPAKANPQGTPAGAVLARRDDPHLPPRTHILPIGVGPARRSPARECPEACGGRRGRANRDPFRLVPRERRSTLRTTLDDTFALTEQANQDQAGGEDDEGGDDEVVANPARPLASAEPP